LYFGFFTRLHFFFYCIDSMDRFRLITCPSSSIFYDKKKIRRLLLTGVHTVQTIQTKYERKIVIIEK